VVVAPLQPAPDDGRGWTPRDRTALAVRTYGADEVVAWCAGLLAGDVPLDEPTRPHLTWIGGPAATRLVDDPDADPVGRTYWPQVWAARALLYVWDDETVGAVAAVVSALEHPAWRVREMAAKVVGRHEVGAAAEALLALADDEVPRVRAAVVRALGAVGESEALDVVRVAMDDPDPAVHRAAELSLRRLQQRLDVW
jgi:hypothetical protein